MASRATLEKALNNPNVRQFLDLLSYAEGTQGNGYRTAFGGGRLKSLADHPRYLKTFKQTNGKTNKTSAAGRYQFLRGTWDGLAKRYGFNDFGERNQDLGAVALLAQNGALPYVLKGDWNNAIAKSGRTWASLPTSPHPQPTKSWKKVQKFMNSHKGGQGLAAQQPNTPPPDPRLSMSAPELLASLKSGGKMSDNELFVNLANGNGRAAQEINYLLEQGHNPADIAGQLGLKVDIANAPQPQASEPVPRQTQEPSGFGTFETITNELPKLKQQGLNPYQAIYALAQRQDKVGESIRTAYSQGMTAEHLTEYFGVNDLWQAPNEPSSNTSPKNASVANPTTRLSLG